MDYTTLIAARSTSGSIKQYVNDDAIPSTEILADAEAWVYERLRIFQMLRTVTSLTFSIGSETLTLPTDFVGLRKLAITGVYKKNLQLRTLDQVIEKRPYTDAGALDSGAPNIFYWDGTYFQFDCKADIAYPTVLIYYAQPAALGAGNTTNFLTSRFPHILRNATLGKAYEWKRSPGGIAETTLNKALADIAEANANSDMAMQNMAVM